MATPVEMSSGRRRKSTSKGLEGGGLSAFRRAGVKVLAINAFDIFRKLDKDGSGELDRQEIRAALKELGVDPDSRLARQQLRKYDEDNSGTLDIDEFTRYVKDVQESQALLAELGGEALLAQLDSIPCMSAMSGGDRLALLTGATKRSFSANSLCLVYPPDESFGQLSYKADCVHIILSGEARLLLAQGGEGNRKLASTLHLTGAGPSDRAIREALGEPLAPVSTLGPLSLIFDNLLSGIDAARWCLQPAYGSIEVLTLPKKEWEKAIGDAARKEVKEQAAQHARCLCRRARENKAVADAHSALLLPLTSATGRRVLRDASPKKKLGAMKTSKSLPLLKPGHVLRYPPKSDPTLKTSMSAVRLPAIAAPPRPSAGRGVEYASASF